MPYLAQCQKEEITISEEVTKLLKKQAIQAVQQAEGQYLSQIFTVPKRDGSFRPVINLQPLNHPIIRQHFKMKRS